MMAFMHTPWRMFPLFLPSIFLGCNEILPPRTDPQDFLETSVAVIEGAVTFRDSTTVDQVGSFFIRAKNIYSEVLQGGELIRADIEVWPKALPGEVSAVRATKSHLMNPGIVFGSVVTLGPDTSATLLRQWNHRTGTGRPYWEFVPRTLKHNQRGEPYYEYDPIRFVARARVQIFRDTQPAIVGSFEFTLVYIFFL
jgi:hypothetical protein